MFFFNPILAVQHHMIILFTTCHSHIKLVFYTELLFFSGAFALCQYLRFAPIHRRPFDMYLVNVTNYRLAAYLAIVSPFSNINTLKTKPRSTLFHFFFFRKLGREGGGSGGIHWKRKITDLNNSWPDNGTKVTAFALWKPFLLTLVFSCQLSTNYRDGAKIWLKPE